ncbi:MAG: hypothetical protein FE78DRAFT_67129 [Acidomyces sp. 'richmondensis']|nr:MAG: hypothetical protein FE78DRAFT_67129 [Acidomyces sp. 'richmondensis']
MPLIKVLNLDREDFWEPPRPEAIKAFLGWMRANRTVHGHEKLSEFHVPQQGTLCSFIEIYAAAVALKVRPFPHHLYASLLCELSAKPPKVADIQYLALRVPLDDHAVTRSITSAVNFHEKGDYIRNEWTGILAMRDSEDWRYLYHRLKRIQNKGRFRENDKQIKSETEAYWNEMGNQAGGSPGGEKRRLGISRIDGKKIDPRRSCRQTQIKVPNSDSNLPSVPKNGSLRPEQMESESMQGKN